MEKKQPNGIDKLKAQLETANEMKFAYEQLFKSLLDQVSDVTHGRKDNLEDVLKHGYMSLGSIGKEYSAFGE